MNCFWEDKKCDQSSNGMVTNNQFINKIAFTYIF